LLAKFIGASGANTTGAPFPGIDSSEDPYAFIATILAKIESPSIKLNGATDIFDNGTVQARFAVIVGFEPSHTSSSKW